MSAIRAGRGPWTSPSCQASRFDDHRDLSRRLETVRLDDVDHRAEPIEEPEAPTRAAAAGRMGADGAHRRLAAAVIGPRANHDTHFSHATYPARWREARSGPRRASRQPRVFAACFSAFLALSASRVLRRSCAFVCLLFAGLQRGELALRERPSLVAGVVTRSPTRFASERHSAAKRAVAARRARARIDSRTR